jgi:hypothetical protein
MCEKNLSQARTKSVMLGSRSLNFGVVRKAASVFNQTAVRRETIERKELLDWERKESSLES